MDDLGQSKALQMNRQRFSLKRNSNSAEDIYSNWTLRYSDMNPVTHNGSMSFDQMDTSEAL